MVRIEASALMSYLKAYVEGRLPIYSPPDGPFTPGGNAIGIVHAIGPEVYHVKVGQRVVISSHIVANENAPEPAQFLLGHYRRSPRQVASGGLARWNARRICARSEVVRDADRRLGAIQRG